MNYYLQTFLAFNISSHFLKLLCTTVKTKKDEKNNVAIVLPVLDDKAVPNFYDNFVNY